MDSPMLGLSNAPMEIGDRMQRPEAMMKSLKALAAGKTAGERRAALKEAAEEMESVFVYQMLAAMRKTISSGGLIEKNSGERVFESMLDEEWAKKLSAKSGPNSISAMLYRQLSHQLGLDESEEKNDVKPSGDSPVQELQFLGPDVPSLKLTK